MNFEAILRTIVEGCGGGIGAALMGNDGIPIEEYTASKSPGSSAAGEFDHPVEVGTAGVEFGRTLMDIRRASDALGGGPLEETIIRVKGFMLVFQPVDDENFLVLALTRDGNLGKARYLIRRHVHAIRQEF
jgi:predicted regulator of Ras-like GTPase activity (Roadblock/LC7/MglB family)